jgi:hypothetical protein
VGSDISTYENNDKKRLLYTREYRNIRAAAADIDVSPATLCHHINGTKQAKLLRRYEFERAESNDAVFRAMFTELMGLESDALRFAYLQRKLEERGTH